MSRCKIQTHAVGNPNISCECVHTDYQARKGLHAWRVKIDPHKFVISNSHVTVIYLRFIKNSYFYAVKRKIENTCTDFFQARRMLQQNGTCRQKIFHFKSIKT